MAPVVVPVVAQVAAPLAAPSPRPEPAEGADASRGASAVEPAALQAQQQRIGQRSTWVSVAVNLLLTAMQLVVGLRAGSQALVADAVHSLSDLVSDFVVLLASRHSARAADADHPFGHRRFETGAALVVGLLLLAVGLGLLQQAAQPLQAPLQAQPVPVSALWMALATLVAKELLFRWLLAVARQVRSSLLVANAWHARSDAASSLVVALGIVGNRAGYPLLDAVAALIVGLMVARMGARYAWQALGDLMDRAADQAEVDAIHQTLAATPGVHAVHDLRTRKMGDLVTLDVHLEVDATLSVEAGHAIAVLARQRVMRHHRVIDVMTHVDPWKRPDLDHIGSPPVRRTPSGL